MDPGAGVEHGGQNGIIAAAVRGGPIDCRQNRLDLVVLHILHLPGAGSFKGYAENPLSKLQSVGDPARKIAEECMDGREAHVAGGGAVAALLLQMQKKGEDLLSSDVVDVQLGHRPPSSCGDKAEAQRQAVAVTADRMGAHPSQTRKVVGEKIAQATRQDIGLLCLHRPPPSKESGVISPPQRCANCSLAEAAGCSTKGR